MRVLQLIDSLEAGGAERMAVNIANTVSDTVEGSYICATRQEGLLKASIQPKVSYLFLNKQGTLDVAAIKRLYTYIKKEQITIIHAHSTSFFMATLMKWLRPSLKIVWHDHYGNSAYVQERQYGVLKQCSRYFSMVLSVNTVLATWAKDHLKCDRVAYVPNFAIQEEGILPLTQLKGVDGTRILCLANLRAQKDHHTLLKAFQLVHAEYPDWTLHCVGQDFKDGYSQSVYNRVSELHLEEHVFFYGSCPDTGHIINQSDIGVLSSVSEGLPLALLEYGLGRLPIVATNVGDCSRVLPKAGHQFLVAPAQPTILAEQLLILMESAERRKMMGDLNYQHVLGQFSVTAVKDKLMGFYSQL